MRIGTLTQQLAVYRMVEKQSSSGAMTREKLLVTTLRAAITKQKGFFSAENHEENDVVRIAFETWLDKRILDTDTVIWCNQEFKIYLIEYNYLNRTMKLNLQKINK
jgi:hypothetical protein